MGKLYKSNEDIVLTPATVSVDNDPAPPTPPAPTKPLTQFFTTGKVNAGKYMLDNGPLSPSRLAHLSGTKFEARYRQELDAILYNDLEQLDHVKLETITQLYAVVINTHRPIGLMSQGFRKKLPTICQVLNQFYHDNLTVISGIHQQLQ